MEEIERSTVGQSANPLWHEIRKGRITASGVGTIVKRKVITDEFVKECKVKKDISKIPAIRWGVLHEKEAVEKYIEETKNVFSECGIFLCKDDTWLGGTPDGLVYDAKEDSHGILEIKCPYSIRGYDPKSCFKRLHFTKTTGELRKSHNYYYQIQTQLHTSGYTWCDFAIWTPIDIYIQRITRDDVFLKDKVIPKLRHFYTNHWTEQK